MQSESFKFTGLTVVISALGFLSRWLQNMQLYDESGLPNRGLGISVWLIALIVLTVAGLLAAVFYLKRFKVPSPPEETMAHHSFLQSAVGFVAAAVLFLSGCLMLIGSDAFLYPSLRRFLGLATLAAAVCVLLMTTGKGRARSKGFKSFYSVILVLFACFWLIVVYKENSGQPATWSFAPEILAGCAAIAAFYYLAGFWLGKPSPYASIYFCYLSVFLCTMCIIDSYSAADSIAYAGMALLFGLWGYTLTENLEKPEKEVKYKL